MAGGFRSLPQGFFYRVFRTWRLASPGAGKLSQGEEEVERGESERDGGRDRDRRRQGEGEREREKNYPLYDLTL